MFKCSLSGREYKESKHRQRYFLFAEAENHSAARRKWRNISSLKNSSHSCWREIIFRGPSSSNINKHQLLLTKYGFSFGLYRRPCHRRMWEGEQSTLFPRPSFRAAVALCLWPLTFPWLLPSKKAAATWPAAVDANRYRDTESPWFVWCFSTPAG